MTQPRPFDNPWTQAGNETEVLKNWFIKSVPTMRIAHVHDRAPTIVDFHANSASVALIKELVLLGRKPTYVVVDEDLNIPVVLRSHLGAPGGDSVQIRHFPGTLETFAPGGFDLAVVNDILPYTASIDDAVRRAVDRAKSVLFIQSGEHGLRTIRRQFSHLFGDYPNLLSTGENVKTALRQIDLQGRDVREVHLETQVDISNCLVPNDEQGRRMIEFILNRPYADIAPDTLTAVRSFLADTYGGSGGTVTHDIDIVYVS